MDSVSVYPTKEMQEAFTSKEILQFVSAMKEEWEKMDFTRLTLPYDPAAYTEESTVPVVMLENKEKRLLVTIVPCTDEHGKRSLYIDARPMPALDGQNRTTLKLN